MLRQAAGLWFEGTGARLLQVNLVEVEDVLVVLCYAVLGPQLEISAVRVLMRRRSLLLKRQRLPRPRAVARADRLAVLVESHGRARGVLLSLNYLLFQVCVINLRRLRGPVRLDLGTAIRVYGPKLHVS